MSSGHAIAWTPELLDERLAHADAARATPEPPRSVWAHAEAAAVLATFDPDRLRPMRTRKQARSLHFLLENSVLLAKGPAHHKWRLLPQIRREALARLGDREAIRAACERNPQAAGDTLREAFLQICAGPGRPDPSTLDYRHLLALGEATALLEGVLKDLPSAKAIEQETERAAVIEPLRELAGPWFRGRKRELDELADYVGVLPAGTLRSLRRSARTHLRGRERPPLMILGPGGIGKSTLLAKFMLEHVEHGDVVFVYLDFDRPTINGSEPGTILLEAARQIAVQAKESHARRWRISRQIWAEALAEAASRWPGPSGATSRSQAQLALIDQFASEFEATFSEETPLLVALDTFEEVQYHSPAFAESLWEFLDVLSDRLPVLRTVVAGRAPIEKRTTFELKLEALDEEAAIGFLEGHGVSDPAAARMLVARLGRSPLTLRLAVDVMRRDNCQLDSLAAATRAQRLFVLHIDQVGLQVELYRRILDHIHEPDVRKLAHPGLVLPRITPELIRNVLAEPCNVTVDSDERALELFEELSREISLVRFTDDGALEHRHDLRRAMLPMMREDEPDGVEAIHRQAVRYHSSRDSVIDREELIYHRLALGEDPSVVDQDWHELTGERLIRWIGDLPLKAQAYLAARLDVEVDPEARKLATREDSERQVGSEARELLATDRPKHALAVLRKVRDRPAGSALYLCEAQAYRALGENAKALETIDRALEPAPPQASGGNILKLVVLGAEIEASRGPSEQAEERIEQAFQLASSRDRYAETLKLAVLRLRNWQALTDDDGRKRAAARAELIEDLLTLPRSALEADTESAQALAGELGAESPILLRAVAQMVGLPTLRRERVRRAMILWDKEYGRRLQTEAAALSIMEQPRAGDPGGAMEVLVGLLRRHPLPPGAARSLATEIRWALRDEDEDAE